jgi:lipopolysaccharide biosynthesis regulator YciM
MGVKTVNHTDDIDGQITRLREAQEAIKVNKFETALVTLKDLENSEERQIAVRAKMMLGDLLFNQGEFDLASQVYEEIITKHAFSGFVLKALGKLVACSEKLKQPEKQAKYYSLLHDFFEAT